MKAKRLIHANPKVSILEDFAMNSIDNDEVVVRSLASGISMGTEKKVATGQIPINVFEKMGVNYMIGDFSFPLSYGYSLVAEVVDGDSEWLGKRVHLMHPHQDKCVVKKSDLMIIPNDMSDAKATLISNMETALNGYWDSNIRPNEKILIIGFGQIGALLSGVLRIMTDNPIHIIENNSKRRLIAESMDLETIDQVTQSAYHLVYNTAGNAESIETAFGALRQEGRLIELSWFGDKKVSINLGGDFHMKRLKMISSQVSHIPIRKKGSWDFKRRKEAVIELLQNPWFDKLSLEAIPFSQSPQFFNKLRKNELSEIAYYFTY